MSGTTNPDWFAENEQISEKEPDFGEVVLLPKTMKSPVSGSWRPCGPV